MRARNYDTRLSEAAFAGLIQQPVLDSVSLPCNALLKAVPKGAAFPYDGFTISNQLEPYMFTAHDNHIEFYGEANQVVSLTDAQLFIHTGLGNWKLIAESS